jgi:pimeloyl-ACP methyl ester carboxylesterase
VLVGHSMGGAFAVHAAALGGATQHSTAQHTAGTHALGTLLAASPDRICRVLALSFAQAALTQKDVARCCYCYEAPPCAALS